MYIRKIANITHLVKAIPESCEPIALLGRGLRYSFGVSGVLVDYFSDDFGYYEFDIFYRGHWCRVATLSSYGLADLKKEHIRILGGVDMDLDFRPELLRASISQSLSRANRSERDVMVEYDYPDEGDATTFFCDFRSDSVVSRRIDLFFPALVGSFIFCMDEESRSIKQYDLNLSEISRTRDLWRDGVPHLAGSHRTKLNWTATVNGDGDSDC